MFLRFRRWWQYLWNRAMGAWSFFQSALATFYCSLANGELDAISNRPLTLSTITSLFGPNVSAPLGIA